MNRSNETRTIEVQGNSVQDGRAELDAVVPDGWELQFIKTEKG